MILPTQMIRARIGMIKPFTERSVAFGMSYGLSHAGYDVRLAEDVLLWPKGIALASTIEKFDMPTDIVGELVNKSSMARRFIVQPNTRLEPGWRGYLTLEIINLTWRFARLRAGMPIGAIEFKLLAAPTEFPYGGKYQDQPSGPVSARTEG